MVSFLNAQTQQNSDRVFIGEGRDHYNHNLKHLSNKVMAISILSDTVLVESRAARENQLGRMSHEKAQGIFEKVKGLYFALWKGVGVSTTEGMATFYEVPEVNIRQLLKSHRDEFESDGLKTLRSRDLNEVRDLLSLTSTTVNATIWTPRAALRLGMLLQNSAVAKAVRTTLLDAVEKVVPAQAQENERLKLELELARARDSAARSEDAAARSQERLMAASQAIATIHGAGMVALILGKPDAIVEPPPTIVEKTVLVNPSGKLLAAYQGISKTKLAKRFGMKKPQDVVSWLQTIGKAELLQRGLTATPCEFVPWEFVKELDTAWSQRQGSRQRLLGE